MGIEHHNSIFTRKYKGAILFPLFYPVIAASAVGVAINFVFVFFPPPTTAWRVNFFAALILAIPFFLAVGAKRRKGFLRRRGFDSEELNWGCPHWMVRLGVVIQICGGLSFVLFCALLGVTKHGSEWPPIILRLAAIMFIAFHYVVLLAAYPAARKIKCAGGHVVSAMLRACDECGIPLPVERPLKSYRLKFG
jgi:phage shock protein PspC (stress-responsive transcriptional regulator)